MRLLVLFDLPVVKESERKKYTRFRKFLLNDGYDMLQFSIYSRICKGTDGVNKHMKRLQENVPDKGAVRAMIVTEKQYAEIVILVGKREKKESQMRVNQLTLF